MNRITNTGTSYDANGNLTAMPGLTMTYNTDNRMISNSSGDAYLYDAAGQRVAKTNGSTMEYYFYGVDGNLLYTWPGGNQVYFGKKLIYNSSAAVVTDRLGSVMKEDPTRTSYFPYGDEPTTTEQNRPKFATYFRDSTIALDYAQQRYYASTLARFTSPDPGPLSPSLPQSWNRYSYAWNDPVNYNDGDGMLPANIGFGDGGGMGCVANGMGTWPLVDASNACPPGFTAEYGRYGQSYSPLQQLFDAVDQARRLGAVNWANHDGSLLSLSIADARTVEMAAGACVFAPEICWAVAIAGTVYTVYVLAPRLADLVSIIRRNNSPVRGQPDSTATYPNSKGGRTVRTYGNDGTAVKDVDYGDNHGGRSSDPHVHDWDWSKGGPNRGPYRDPAPGGIP